uniref:U-box domain-containing protein n=1 Tax=Kalanchoe fedtschenkoi TaxID=63787 RepID=A0A7N1A158_KALFE
MVSLERSRQMESTVAAGVRMPPRYFYKPPSRVYRNVGRSMRTIRSNLYRADGGEGEEGGGRSGFVTENLTDSVMDMRLGELALRSGKTVRSSLTEEEMLELAQDLSDVSSCSSDVSGELQRLACLPSPRGSPAKEEPEGWVGFLQRDSFSTEIIEHISAEDLQPTVKLCVLGLKSPSAAVKRSAAAKLRLLAKDRSDNRALIGESGAVPALIPLLRCSDASTQEHAVTALLNLSLLEENRKLITEAGGLKSLVYVLKTGTEISKQNAACTLLNLSLVEENKASIGASGAIPPLVALLINGSERGKKDALTTLYKLCSIRQNKEKAVSAGAVKPLVTLVAEQGTGLAEKAMVVLSSLASIEDGKEAVVEEGGIAALVEAVVEGSGKGKEFAVLTLSQLCADSVKNRGLLVREGGIPPLVALSQHGTARAKQKAEALLGYLREPRSDASASSSHGR